MALTDRQQGISGSVAVKPACYVASTANLALSSTQVVDGIAVGSCERVLVKDQTDTTENGIYIADTASWSRAKDFDGASDAIPGTIVYVDRGTFNFKSLWVFNSSSTDTKILIGSTNITVEEFTLNISDIPLSIAGDLLTHDGSSMLRLSIGTTGTVLVSTGTEPSWALITSENLGSSSVTSAAIASSAVTATGIASSAVTSTHLSSSAVTASAIASSAVTGPKIAMGSDVHGDILYRGSTGYARLGAGSSGRFLQTLSSGTDPIWAAVGSYPIATAQPSSASSVILAGMSTSTGRKFYTVKGHLTPVVDGDTLYLRASTDGATFISTLATYEADVDTANSGTNTNNAAQIAMITGSSASLISNDSTRGGIGFDIDIYNGNGTNVFQVNWQGHFHENGAQTAAHARGSGIRLDGKIIKGVELSFELGNIERGHVTLFEVESS